MHKVRVRVKVKVMATVTVMAGLDFSSSYAGKGSPGKGYSDALLDLG